MKALSKVILVGALSLVCASALAVIGTGSGEFLTKNQGPGAAPTQPSAAQESFENSNKANQNQSAEPSNNTAQAGQAVQHNSTHAKGTY